MPRYTRRRRRLRYGRKRTQRRRRRNFRKKANGTRRRAGGVRSYGIGGPTLQIATRVQPNLRLKFVYNQTYTYLPYNQAQSHNHGGSKQFMMRVGFCANQIASIHANGTMYGEIGATDDPAHGIGTVWKPQNHATPQPVANAKGFDEWRERYRYSTVIGSKITVTAKTIGFSQSSDSVQAMEPTLIFLHKVGNNAPQDVFNDHSDANEVNSKAYVSKAHILNSNVSTGCKLTMGYSAKRFEGVKGHIIGNKDYSETLGTMAQPQNYTAPVEKSTFILGICNAKGTHHTPNMTHGSTAPLIIQVKVEYLVALTEPRTGINPPPGPAGMDVGN